MTSLNKVFLIGNLGRDPEVRYSSEGSPIASLSVATASQWKDKSGNKKESTEWHRVSVFGPPAEFAGKYLKKGAQVFVEGRIQTRKWQDKDGQDKYTTEVIASDLKAIGGKQEPEKTEPAKTQPGKTSATSWDDMEDSIPF